MLEPPLSESEFHESTINMAFNFPYTIVSKGFAWTLKAKLNNKLALCSEVEGRRSFLEMSLNPSCSIFSGPFPKLHALLKDPVDSIAPPSRFSLTPFEAAFCHHLCCSWWHNIFGLPLENYWDVCLEFSKLVWFDFGITHKGTDWWMILQQGAFSWALPLARLQSKCYTVDFVNCHYLPRRW